MRSLILTLILASGPAAATATSYEDARASSLELCRQGIIHYDRFASTEERSRFRAIERNVVALQAESVSRTLTVQDQQTLRSLKNIHAPRDKAFVLTILCRRYEEGPL